MGEGEGDIVFEQLNDLKETNSLRADIFTGSATCASLQDMNQPTDSEILKRFRIAFLTEADGADLFALMAVIAFLELGPPIKLFILFCPEKSRWSQFCNLLIEPIHGFDQF